VFTPIECLFGCFCGFFIFFMKFYGISSMGTYDGGFVVGTDI
jgi:hypothetical protein